MASRQLFQHTLPTSCTCTNICNQITSKRLSCPCLVNDSYCSPLCSCGTSRYSCINRPGKGGQLDIKFDMQISEEEEDSDADPEWFVDSDEESEDPQVSLHDPNESLQVVVDERYEDLPPLNQTSSTTPLPSGVGNHNKDLLNKDPTTIPLPRAVRKHNKDPLKKIRDASRSELFDIIAAMIEHTPNMNRFLTVRRERASVAHSGNGEGASSNDGSTTDEQLPGQVPLSEPGSNPEQAPDPDPEPGPGIHTPSWCKCKRCRQMPTAIEQRCCRKQRGPCITQTAANDLMVTCLDRRMLVVCIHDRNEIFLLNDDPTAHDTLRNMAYRRYVLWEYGHLGAKNRKVIPSCVVWEIRRKYPALDNVYVGYIPSRLN